MAHDARAQNDPGLEDGSPAVGKDLAVEDVGTIFFLMGARPHDRDECLLMRNGPGKVVQKEDLIAGQGPFPR